jgi:hypothetical protein
MTLQVATTVALLPYIGSELMAQTSLSQTLHVTETQAGIAGNIGWSWTVEPDGTWRAQRVGPGQMSQQSRTGTLTPAELDILSKAVDRLDDGSRPDTKNKIPVNPYKVQVRYGEKTAEVVLPPGGQYVARESTPDSAAPALTIADTLREATRVE